MDAQLEQRVAVFHALADPTRLAIVDLLAVQDLSPDALAVALKVPSNLLAHHLKTLRNADIVSRHHSQHDRRRAYLHLELDTLEGLLPAQAPVSVVPRVVFVCTQNSARSVLAEAIWSTVSDVPAASAGTLPAHRVNPRARTAARRAGLTLATTTPKPLDDVLLDDDLVISVCDAVNEELGDLANPRLHWSVPDPAIDDTDAAFTATVEDLRTRVGRTAPTVLHRAGRARRGVRART